jgi:isopenicillin-N epimerase
MADPFWSNARKRMLLDPAVINLNTGSFGPLPRVVFDEVTRLRQRLAEEPMDFLLRGAPPLLWQSRERLAHFIGGQPEKLIFMVAGGVRLDAPGEILMTDHEYGAMHWCWERAAQRQGLTIRTFPLPILASSPEEIVAAAVAAMTERTRLFFFSHVLSATGLVLPARELCAEARRRGILTVVDGAHTLAFVPLTVEAIGADFYGSNCHKWLLAPTGSGFLYLHPASMDRLQPMQVSWGYRPDPHRLDERDDRGSTYRIQQFEFEGTRDPSPWIAVSTALDFQAQLNFNRIRGRIGELTKHVRRRLTGLMGLRLATPDHPELHGAMTAFRLPPGVNAVALRQGLWEKFRIEAPIVERPEGLLIRVSTHFYNTEEEVDRLAFALEELLAEAAVAPTKGEHQ